MRISVLLLVVAYSTAASAGEATRLTDSGARNGQPFFSPDGSKISFVSNRSGRWQVWVMEADGSRPKRLTDLDTDAGWPSWTPDGERILFYARVDGRFRILQCDLEGRVSPLFDDGQNDLRPLLSHDGKRLLFDRYDATTADNHDIFVRSMPDGRVRNLTNDPGYDSDARWSPDGEWVVFHSDRGASKRHHTQVFVMRSDGTALARLTSGPSKAAYPAWSPDGSRIAFVCESEANRDVCIMDRDGSPVLRATAHPGADGEPAWSPDGRTLVFPTDRYGGMELVALDVADP